jgi:hypothetical protein
MKNDLDIQESVTMSADGVVRMFGLLMKQIVDLRETLSFYEHELFSANVSDETAFEPTKSESSSEQTPTVTALFLPPFWPFPIPVVKQE